MKLCDDIQHLGRILAMAEVLPRASDWKRILALIKQHEDKAKALDPSPHRLELDVLEHEAKEAEGSCRSDWYKHQIAKVQDRLKSCEDEAEERARSLEKIDELSTLLEGSRSQLTEEIRLVNRNATVASLIPSEITDYYLYFKDRWISEPLYRDMILERISIVELFNNRTALLARKREIQPYGEGSKVLIESDEFYRIMDNGPVRDYVKNQFLTWKAAQ